MDQDIRGEVCVTELTVAISLHTSSGMPIHPPNTVHVSQYLEKGNQP